MKKYIKKSIFVYMQAVILVLAALSCDEILDKQPLTSISDASFWSSEEDAMLALVGCYKFPSGWSSDDFAHPQGLMYLDLAGGNGVEKENFTTQGMASSNTIATSGNIHRYWSNAYSQIAHYNTFLDKIVDAPMDESKKEMWIGEVKSLRAYYLFYLAFHFKDIPMPLTTLGIEDANTIVQTPQSDVYKQLEEDLTAAISVLPLERSSSEYGRFTKGAAQVLLSRLYLAQNKWTEAAAALKPIIESGVYQLDRSNGEDSYERLFQVGGEYSSEMIFIIQYMQDNFTTARYIYQTPESNGGWHQFAPYNELVKAFFCTDGKGIENSSVYDDEDPYANRDPRLYASIFLPPLGSYEGTVYKDVTYNCFQGPNKADTYNKFTLFNGYCPKKGLDPSISNLYESYVHTPLMRYAEVLLSYLEAVNESSPGSVGQELLDLTINDIRDRVNLPPIQIANVSSQELVREAVRKERRVELVFEGFRYFDVLRWGIAAQELNHTFTGVKLSDDPNAPNFRGSGASASPVDEDMYYQFETRRWSDHNRYFPIPQNDLNINENLVQNEGYN
ncbi:RagB/SusD family nutrient uptake outer membrane protein [Sunxiuqinia indica]|uniref:RagB/SusD family nutrient uptake outer membrane protein n=1 Tax=Sunxiuqinia indica TaxID=2692584 RepID=UPI00135A7B07|nr:RagB/SusD family nutrient uptake outer membrane protein [Sunxiuqinia indica]